jgi:hypothetical protein
VTALREQEALLVINNVTGDNMLLLMKAFFASQPPQQLGISRVIISSSEEGALQAAGCSPIIHMPGLDRAAAVDLFDATCTLTNKNAEFKAGYVALRDRALECVGYNDRGAGVNGQPQVTYIPLVVEATARVLAQCSTLTAASDIVKHLAERGALGALTFGGCMECMLWRGMGGGCRKYTSNSSSLACVSCAVFPSMHATCSSQAALAARRAGPSACCKRLWTCCRSQNRQPFWTLRCRCLAGLRV